ncbi:MAG: mechanosensitive ion channel family protein [bacterium]
MIEFIQNWLAEQGLNQTGAVMLARGMVIVVVIALSIVANAFAKKIILRMLTPLIARSRTKWDDAILKRKVLYQIAHLAPALVIYLMVPIALRGNDTVVSVVLSATLIYIIIVVALALDAFLNASVDIYRTTDISKQFPIKSFVQMVKIGVYFVAVIFVISIILNKTPFFLLSGVGAMTAVLMLIFKDPILGFVAGVQLSANKMLSRGDWIEMPKYGADGDVLEVALTTVKVQNWDKTITTIPTYALISESFKNWQGMEQSGGRRIKRSINIDMGTITFCTEEMLQRFSKIQFIADYIEQKKKELREFNQSAKVDETSLVNGRRMTNIGTFRAYVNAYLKNHPKINLDMTFLIRQLPPTQHGLPIEIYVFCKDKVWAHYEAILADIFDHFLAVIPEFDLRVFQDPTGGDFKQFSAPQPNNLATDLH